MSHALAFATKLFEHFKAHRMQSPQINNGLWQSEGVTLWQKVPAVNAARADRAAHFWRFELTAGDQLGGVQHGSYSNVRCLSLGQVTRLRQHIDTCIFGDMGRLRRACN